LLVLTTNVAVLRVHIDIRIYWVDVSIIYPYVVKDNACPYMDAGHFWNTEQMSSKNLKKDTRTDKEHENLLNVVLSEFFF